MRRLDLSKLYLIAPLEGERPANSIQLHILTNPSLGATMGDLPFKVTKDVIFSIVPDHLRNPRVGIVCGSGLSTLAESMHDVVKVPYAKLPGFGESTGTCHFILDLERRRADAWPLSLCALRTVPGHGSALAFGLVGNVPVVAMLGRVCTRASHGRLYV